MCLKQQLWCAKAHNLLKIGKGNNKITLKDNWTAKHFLLELEKLNYFFSFDKSRIYEGVLLALYFPYIAIIWQLDKLKTHLL